MKKTITFLSICLLAIAGMQTANAQTKEETIAWIKEKMQKNIIGIYDINITPCKISWSQYTLDAIFEFELNPGAAVWKVDKDGHSVKASAKVIKRKYHDAAYDSGETDYVGSFGFTNDTTLLSQMADNLNNLSGFCKE